MRLTLFTALLVIGQSLFAQHAVLRGLVSDTAEHTPLFQSSIMVLQSKDSFLISFTRADVHGAFSFSRLPAGKLICKISHPGYAEYVTELELKDSSEINLGKIPMILKSQLLQEVVVHGNMAAIRINGDTLEFKADSFKVQQGATVEELLKRLPGIQIDKNGKITAQGQTVKKVLVDGEEFFGDDPTLVTQNLRADMVDKVQVFDKKSDQAAFTGIDDGEKNKTINLQLKENKKNGYFGKVEAGAGSNGYYNNQVMFNLFKNKLKFSGYGILSNVGTIGLNWQDNNSYGQSFASSLDYDETMGYFTYSGSNDDLDSWGGQYNGQGLPVVKTGGLHFNNKWNQDKQSVNLNYKILDLDVTGQNASRSEYILPDTLYYTNSTQAFHNHILRNKASGIFEMTLDSGSTLKINVDASKDHKTTQSAYTSEYLAEDSSLVNRNKRQVTTVGDPEKLNTNLLWRKKFRKKGRTLSFNFKEEYQSDNSSGYLNSDTKFGKDSLQPEQLTDQYKTFRNKTLALDSRLVYTEPLSAISSLAINYGLSGGNSQSDRNSFNKSAVGKYDAIDSAYSNDYHFSLLTQKTGLLYNFSGRKLHFNIGSDIGFTGFKQQNLDSGLFLNRHFVNWYPQSSISYKFEQQNVLSFRYSGRTQQPGIEQLQPLANNQDPLNIYIGNPLLKPSFNNSFSLNYYKYKALSETGVFVNLYGQSTSNAISSKDFVDSLGRRIYQSVNVNGNYNLSGNMDYSFKIQKADMNMSLGTGYNVGRNVNIVNDELNETMTKTYSFSFRMNKSKEKKYEFSLSPTVEHTSSISSIQQSINTKYWTFNLRADGDIFLPLKFQMHTDCEFNFRQKTSVFDVNNNTIFWNAWFGKKFFKKENLLLKIQANDILNQNIGFNRVVNSNYVSQNTYTTIQRYLMLSLVWNFAKAGSAQPKP
ncbi:MAG: outer membrane beta-barrel protein [Bacteroidota bacterium]|nr:outer membrane beta-barrel protein [Bacteroidota bacterium]